MIVPETTDLFLGEPKPAPARKAGRQGAGQESEQRLEGPREGRHDAAETAVPAPGAFHVSVSPLDGRVAAHCVRRASLDAASGAPAGVGHIRRRRAGGDLPGGRRRNLRRRRRRSLVPSGASQHRTGTSPRTRRHAAPTAPSSDASLSSFRVRAARPSAWGLRSRGPSTSPARSGIARPTGPSSSASIDWCFRRPASRRRPESSMPPVFGRRIGCSPPSAARRWRSSPSCARWGSSQTPSPATASASWWRCTRPAPCRRAIFFASLADAASSWPPQACRARAR